MRYLVTDASGWGDTATNIGGVFMNEFANWLHSTGIDLTFLRQERVKRDIWDSSLKGGSITRGPIIDWISHMGHGNYVTITGYQQNVLAMVGGYDPSLYKDKGLHFLSCQCGKLLLPDMVSKGLRVAVGYDENFTFYYTPGKPPLEDELASSFFDSHLALDRSLAQGANILVAKEDSDQRFTFEASEWRNQGRPDVAAVLLFDRDHHVLHGDGAWVPNEPDGPPTPPDYIEVVLMKRKTGGADVEFRVSDTDTKDPIEGALIEWGEPNIKGVRRLFQKESMTQTETTDEDGSAWFRDVPPGIHPWLVTHEDYITVDGITEID